jgi:hypothetical protein
MLASMSSISCRLKDLLRRNMMIWEIETSDLQSVFDRVNLGLKSGTTVLIGAVDGSSSNSNTFTPITRRVTAEEIRGKTPDEVRALALEGA